MNNLYQSMVSAWFRLLEFFMPEPPILERERLRRDMLMVGVALVLGVLSLAPACFRFGVEGLTSPSGFILLGASALYLMAPWVFRVTSSRTMAGTLIITVSLATLWLLVLFEGGLDSEALIWFPFLAIASGFWAERDVVGFAVLLAILSLLGLYVAQSHGLVPVNQTSPAQHFIMATVSTVFAILLSAVLTWLYEANRLKTEHALEDANEALATMLSSLPDLLLQLNGVGRIVKLQVPAQGEIWAPVAAMAPSHISALVQPASLPDLLSRIQSAIGSRKSSISKTVLLVEGRQLVCELRLVPFQHKEAIALIRDITEAERLERAKDEFVGAIRTELQAPVSAIRRISGTLAEGTIATLPTEATELVKTLDRNAEMLMTMLDDLLRFDNLQSGSLSIRRAPFALGPFLEEAVRLAHSALEEFGSRVTLEALALNEDAQIRTDRMRVMQLFSRLLALFSEHLPPGSDVKVQAKRDVSEYEVVLVCDCHVSDVASDFRQHSNHYFGGDVPQTLESGGKVIMWMLAMIAAELGVALRFHEALGGGCGFTLRMSVYEKQSN